MIDHLVLASPGLEEGVARVREVLGVEPVPGGRHPRWGTRNALVGLGERTYLEVIAADPEAEPPDAPRPFDLDRATPPRLASWALRVPELEDRVRRAAAAGVDLGPVLEGSRERGDGTVLRWRLTDPAARRAGGVLPFLIDWGDSRHPAASLDHPLSLDSLRVEHPEPVAIRRGLAALDVDLAVERASGPGLAAVIQGPEARVELR